MVRPGLSLFFLLAGPAWAQPEDQLPRGNFVPLPFDPQFLRQSMRPFQPPPRQFFDQLLDSLKKDPGNFIEPLSKLQNLPSLDSDHLKQIEDLTKKLGIDNLTAPQQVQKVLEDRQFLEKLAENLQKIDGGRQENPFQPPISPSRGNEETQPAWKEWIDSFLQDLEDYDLADWLQDSKILQDTVRDLKRWLDNPGRPEKKDWLDPVLDQLGKLNIDLTGIWDSKTLDRWRALSLKGLPRVRTNGLQLPRFRTVSLPELGTWLPLALFLVGGGILLAVLIRAGSRRRSAGAGNDAEPVPQPIDPGQISTRDDLVRALDYLAWKRFGPAARVWNHRQLTLRLYDLFPAFQDRIESLAGLYEQARYTPGAQELAPPLRDQAREQLSWLAGA